MKSNYKHFTHVKLAHQVKNNTDHKRNPATVVSSNQQQIIIKEMNSWNRWIPDQKVDLEVKIAEKEAKTTSFEQIWENSNSNGLRSWEHIHCEADRREERGERRESLWDEENGGISLHYRGEEEEEDWT